MLFWEKPGVEFFARSALIVASSMIAAAIFRTPVADLAHNAAWCGGTDGYTDGQARLLPGECERGRSSSVERSSCRSGACFDFHATDFEQIRTDFQPQRYTHGQCTDQIL